MKNFNNNLKNFKIALTKEYNTLKKSLKTTLQEAEKLNYEKDTIFTVLVFNIICDNKCTDFHFQHENNSCLT